MDRIETSISTGHLPSTAHLKILRYFDFLLFKCFACRTMSQNLVRKLWTVSGRLSPGSGGAASLGLGGAT